ncbi:hypothetical protein DNHGIG_09320 [Collibacillus ludicampi]|jgi:hypothetical protein|uniref:Uncharacterized protein n=1 Tax=Collibacillus ludicampi TaxID=2771369 RepID=A0AAV4LC78_9BACL|nr:hypothetical protein [Collibacillus ludicampi]GIM45383.1 hypothetical protein DNHGIG_09320 [Collibacillus ludicampi]
MIRKFLYRTPRRYPLRGFYLPDLIEDGWYGFDEPDDLQHSPDEYEWNKKEVELHDYLKNQQIQHRLSQLTRNNRSTCKRMDETSGENMTS